MFGTSGIEVLLLLVPLVALVYLFVMQRRRATQVRDVQNALQVGDKVMTMSGMVGTITEVGEDHLISLQIAPKVVVQFDRRAIGSKVN